MKLEILNCLSPGPAIAARPPLLFVHGSYCGAWVWAEHFMPYFARQGHSCHAVSLRGHGDSEEGFATASLDDYVADIHTALDHLGQPCVLIGHSMGGLVVQHCLANDDRVVGAVLLSSVPPSGLASSALHLSLFSPEVCLQFGLLQSLGPQAVTGDVIRKAFFSPATPPEVAARFLPRFQKESHRICVELFNPQRPQVPRGGNRPPILVMGGDADVLVPSSALYETAFYFDADLEVLTGAPHGVMLDELWWQKTADKTLAWLESTFP
ncbi:Predicted hydrolase or acyltransferase [Candidatus Terasakiella magnetica]|nr:Predicted hydrolase or acyltransferase [Candidatus Terasakiella magnetica]